MPTKKKKLEAENRELRRQLRILATEPESPEAVLIKACYRLCDQMEEAFWRGDVRIELVKPDILKEMVSIESPVYSSYR